MTADQNTVKLPDNRDASNTPVDLSVDPHADPAEPDRAEPSPQVSSNALRAAQPWRVAQTLLQLRAQVDTLAPKRSKVSDGTIGDATHASRSSDHNPWVHDGGMAVVTAMDITHDPARGCDVERLAQAFQKSHDRRVKYVIWNRRIMSTTVEPWTWRPYNGENPHNKHLHISVRPEKKAYDDTAPWRIGVLSGGAGTLKLGDRGPEVVALQKMLAEALKRRLDADGVFGPLTRDAVMDFQRGAKLAVDGIAGPKTLAALRKETS